MSLEAISKELVKLAERVAVQAACAASAKFIVVDLDGNLLYRGDSLLGELEAQYPDLWFEACAVDKGSYKIFARRPANDAYLFARSYRT